ncbi:MAG: DUF5131 family protein [Actinomycetota bacterium]
MGQKTGIEWTETTWNPTTGCDRVSSGCDHCYALSLAKRLKAMGSRRYQEDGSPRTSGPGFGLTLHEDKLDEPLRWRSPRVVFVNSMSDLFHAKVPASFIRRAFNVMAATPQHTYQILTKRPRRMARILGDWNQFARRPLVNVWLGTSVEDQRWADQRIPLLLDTPAAVRFLSCEPLLGPVDLSEWLGDGIGWVIAGGESGPGHRPISVDWVRSLRNQCNQDAVPFFFKQWGGRTPKVGGRDLDGRSWDEMPVAGARRAGPKKGLGA